MTVPDRPVMDYPRDARVLLIDVDNVVGAVRPGETVVRARVGALLAAAGPVHHVVACYAITGNGPDRVRSVLAELGVAGWAVPAGANAAETALVEHAHHLADRGCRTFLVASADRGFAQLADLGRLEVMVWDRQPLSRASRNAAQQVHRIALPDPGELPPAAPLQLDDQGAVGVTAGRSDGTVEVDQIPDAPDQPTAAAALGSGPDAGGIDSCSAGPQHHRPAGPRDIVTAGVVAGVVAAVVARRRSPGK